MLAVMQERSFVVTTAYTKTEPLLIAIFALIFLGEHAGPLLIVAIVIATAGVVFLSWPARAATENLSWRPAIHGIVSGGLVAIASVGFSGAIVATGDENFIAAATLMLAISLTIQTVTLTAWLLLRDRSVLRAIFAAWPQSLAAGFLGAFASEGWFLAFAIKNPASVRTLALVEIVIAGIVSRRLFAQTPTLRDLAGLALVIAGIALLFSA
jgi:drug/metabolite transporter (DMT)-like permease